MSEQPKQPEMSEGDLFDQTPKSIKPKLVYARKDDGLGWECTECELNNGWCAKHPRSESRHHLQVVDLESDDTNSSIRIAEKEIAIEEAERKS